ncbi:MAG: biopolymer transporter ExbD [Phycisphaerales bacterium]|nr:biopolymer transporter ExbD [Hyphomonadaceae bacterium]
MTTALYGAPTRARSLAPQSEPNVVPFIDVLLVLLIIFMVTAPTPTVDLQLELPNRPLLIAVAIPPTVIDIEPSPSGYRIFIGAEEHRLEDVAEVVLAHGLQAGSSLTAADVLAEAHVSVRARDQGVSYGAVVAVLDALTVAGYAKVSVFAQKAEGA